MKPAFLDYQVAIPGCEQMISPDMEAERTYQFNLAMKALYQSGCRRFRSAIPVRPRTSDVEKYIIRGYLA